MWRMFRISILLIMLVIAAGVSWGDRFRTTTWTDTLWIGIFPVNGDGSPATDRYIATLTPGQFADIEEFFQREAGFFGVAIERPVKLELQPPVAEPPPALDPGAGALARIAWSLQARYYAWRSAGDALADIRVFVLFHDPASVNSVPHSIGLQKGLLGIAHAFADPGMNAANNIVIVHEVMHTLGATDKYDPATNLPVFPEGYGDPQAQPRYPQEAAEIMAGRTALSATEAVMPARLAEIVVGQGTAAEINWIEAGQRP